MTENQTSENNVNSTTTPLPVTEMSELNTAKPNPWLALIISALVIAGVFWGAIFFSPDDRMPIELKVGEFGKTLPEADRFRVLDDGTKFEKFPLVFKKVKKVPYAPAYRLVIYSNKSKITQRDLRPYELEEGLAVGFSLIKSDKDYVAVVEEMHGGEDIKPISNVVQFTY